MNLPSPDDLATLRTRLLEAGFDPERIDDSLHALAGGDARVLVQELLLRALWADVVDETQPQPQWIVNWRRLAPSGFPFIDVPALERLLAAGADVHDLTAVVRSAQVLMAANLAQVLDTPTLGLGWDLPDAVTPHLRCATGEDRDPSCLPALYPCFASRDPTRRHGAPCSLVQRQWQALPQAVRDEVRDCLRRDARAQAAHAWKRAVGCAPGEAFDAIEEVRGWREAGG